MSWWTGPGPFLGLDKWAHTVMQDTLGILPFSSATKALDNKFFDFAVGKQYNSLESVSQTDLAKALKAVKRGKTSHGKTNQVLRNKKAKGSTSRKKKQGTRR